MPYFTRGEVSIYYETKGSGFPLLTLPPGGMNATIDWWGRSAFNPLEVFSHVEKHPDFGIEAAEAFGQKMCTGEFVLSVSRDFVKGGEKPLLVMPGSNLDHPHATGMEIASLAR